jgi:hypothetical protein
MRDIKTEIMAIAKRERLTIPPVNYRNYDLECESYASEIERTPGLFDKLTVNLWRRIQGFRQTDKSMIPPLLCRRQNESVSDYIERCYVAGGYHKLKKMKGA